jgi:hypothetical protein
VKLQATSCKLQVVARNLRGKTRNAEIVNQKKN